MARKRIAISSGGGIAAGSPFVLDAGLFVSQASPPVANTGRLARLADASLSIIAPGVLAVNSFVLGNTVVDAVGGDRSILIGRNIRQNSGGAVQARDQILIGSTIQMPAAGTGCEDFVCIGTNIIFTTGVGAQENRSQTTILGNNVTTENSAAGFENRNSVGIGYTARMNGDSCVVIGSSARCVSEQSVAVGAGATVAGYSVAVGQGANANSGASVAASSIMIGRRGLAGPACVMIGTTAGGSAVQVDCVGIGWGAASTLVAGNVTASIMIGKEAGCSVSNMCIIGSATAPILTLTFGSGEFGVTNNQTYRLTTSYRNTGLGAALIGDTLQVVAGSGTGIWTNLIENLGLDLMCGVLAAGTTRQPPTSVLALRHSDLNVSLWGGLAATMGSGVKVLFIANATTAPTVAPTGGGLLYVTGGALHWLGSGGTDTAIAPA